MENPTTPTKARTAKELTQTRRDTHGDWAVQARMTDDLMAVMGTGKNWNTLTPGQRQALMMIATKLGRILSGDPSERDHWDDIGGYALLGKQGHER